MTKYKRVLLKLSGEALQGEKGHGIDENRLNEYALQVLEAVELGVEVAIVIGGGNIFRGLSGAQKGFDRVKGDYMGMLATVINALALQSELETLGQKARVLTSFRMEPAAEFYSQDKAIETLQRGEVALLAGGTGWPFFTTDTTAALRGIEVRAEVLLKGTRVDGVYTADPEKDPMAEKFEQLSFDQAIEKKLKIMDQTAFTLCRENDLPIVVFDMNQTGNLRKLLVGENIGTLIKG